MAVNCISRSFFPPAALRLNPPAYSR